MYSERVIGSMAEENQTLREAEEANSISTGMDE